MKDGSGGEDAGGEAGRYGNVIVLGCLIRCDEHRVGLAHVDIQRRIVVLHSVGSFNLNQLHLVALNSEIQ